MADSMAVVSIVDSLPRLLEILADAPKVARGDCFEWIPVQLADLSVRDNAHQSTARHHWACVQVASLTVAGQTYSLSADLDAHITLGSWMKGGSASRWRSQFTRATKKLADTPMLDMEMKSNELVCDERLLVFSFMVHSRGGSTLHRLGQTLNACNLKQKERLGRGMSPPAQVFHLSVYNSNAW